MKESSSGPTRDDGSCAEPRLMPTLMPPGATPGGLTVFVKYAKQAYWPCFKDAAVGGIRRLTPIRRRQEFAYLSSL
jgi:hypothetical protein